MMSPDWGLSIFRTPELSSAHHSMTSGQTCDEQRACGRVVNADFFGISRARRWPVGTEKFNPATETLTVTNCRRGLSTKHSDES
ncbi:hypothetical protein M413DRAFT_442609 [Hebeloma cylindrosporum]|uniref:Uncharacterized protein n=1 Tax=Hebeloma cylindrosporum TaxID=76867 RepID=A0A0C3C725_HEBCY|nr:hypothetical protein M413DRAFT_442609 [Hebeloma cylindrosporum h7]